MELLEGISEKAEMNEKRIPRTVEEFLLYKIFLGEQD